MSSWLDRGAGWSPISARGFLDPAAIDFSFSSRGMNGWLEPGCVVCHWPLSTSLARILSYPPPSALESCPGNFARQPSSGGSASKTGRDEASWHLFLATVLPQVSFLTPTLFCSFCPLLSFSFLFFFSFFCFSFLFLFAHTHTHTHTFSLQCQVSCLADQPTPS